MRTWKILELQTPIAISEKGWFLTPVHRPSQYDLYEASYTTLCNHRWVIEGYWLYSRSRTLSLREKTVKV